jgi:NAD(P)-dependent dehydrogenase (short-subunit alcohol dehydrogenase family)
MAALDGRVALVTGGASGIGRAVAQAMGRAGAAVVVADVALDGGEETARNIRAAGSQALFVAADVARAADVQALVQRTLAAYGRLDIAVNNAGVGGGGGPLHQVHEEDWARSIAVNLTGVWLCMKYEIEPMLARGGGAIVNVSSFAALRGFPSSAPYAAAKHGVVGLTQTAALQYAKARIRVNAVCPGWVQTPLLEPLRAANPHAEADMVAATPLGRLGTPQEIADAVVWLCSDQASFVTGHALAIDGGLSV